MGKNLTIVKIRGYIKSNLKKFLKNFRLNNTHFISLFLCFVPKCPIFIFNKKHNITKEAGIHVSLQIIDANSITIMEE